MTDHYGNIPISGDSPKKPDTPKKRSKTDGKGTKKDRPQTSHSKIKTIYLVIPAVCLFLVASYYGLTSFVVPLYLEKKLPDIFLEKTGLSLSLESAQFNPLNSTLVIQNINVDSLSTASEDTDILDIGSIVIDFNLASIWEKAIITDALHIDTIQCNVRKYHDNTYNISSLLPNSEQIDAKHINSSILAFPYSLNNISVDGGTIIFDDLSTSKVHRIEELRLRLPTLANHTYALDDYIQPEFSAIINDSPLRLTGGDNLAQSAPGQQPTRLTFTLQSVDLPIYAGYLPFQLPVVVQKGEAEIQAEISFQTSEDSNFQLHIDFQTQITNGVITSHDKTLTLNTPSLRLEGTIAPLDSQISLKNLLLRDPLLSVNDSFSKNTVDSLFLEVQKSDANNGNYLQSAALEIGLLIADNGKIVLKSEDTNRTFTQIQLSMREFANRAARKSVGRNFESSFLVSGESKEDSFNFSWQGNFDQNRPTGNIKINNFPASDFLEIVSTDAQLTAKGSADIRGRLRLMRSANSPFAYNFEKGTVLFSSLYLKKKNRELLQSPSIKLSPMQISDQKIDFGNIFIERGKINIPRDDTSLIFLKKDEKRDYDFSGIDFQGVIALSADTNESNPLEMNNVRLQFKEAKETDKDNFAFSANMDPSSTLTAKGNISIAPIEGFIDLAIANMPATILVPTSLTEEYEVGKDTTISVTGRYLLESSNFTGAAEISKGAMRNPKTGTRYTFERAVLGEISFNKNFDNGKGSGIVLQGLDIKNETNQLETKGATISSFSFKESDLRFENISLAETRLTVNPDFTKLFTPFISKSANNLSIDELTMFGMVYILETDQKSRSYIDNFSLTLRELQSAGKLSDNLEFSASFHEKGNIEVKGAFTIHPLQTKLNLTLDDVASDLLNHFATPLANLNVQAYMRGNLAYIYPEGMYSGDVSFGNGSLSTDDTPTISWAEVSLEDFQFQESPFRLTANRCLLKQPQMSFTRTEPHILGTLRKNITTYLQQIDDLEKQQSSPEIEIERVAIQDGNIDYLDNRMRPVWQTEITGLESGIDNFHIGDSAGKTDYYFHGDIQKGAFTLTGTHQPSAEPPEQLQALEIASFPLTEIEQQLTNLFDITFEDSLLSLSLKNESTAENIADLSISSIKAEDHQSTTALALALLSNDSETFSATISLPQSNQSFFNQATRYFQRLIVKSSVSPYLLLEEPFNSLEDNQNVSFVPGTAELANESRDVLSNYALLLQNHPRLMLKLQPIIQRSADTIALRKILTEKEDERVRKENEKLLEEWRQQQSATALPANPDDSITVKDIPTDTLTEFTPITSDPVVVTEDMLQQLAVDRADKIRNFITDSAQLRDSVVSNEYQIQFINTLDLPAVEVELAHIDKK